MENHEGDEPEWEHDEPEEEQGFHSIRQCRGVMYGNRNEGVRIQ
jgi:hypothetical protein